MNAHSLTVTASDSSPRGRVLLAALAALALVCATGLVGSAQAAESESSCAALKEPKLKEEEQVRAESRSTQLPQCRAYEMVSPVDTADSGVGDFFGAAPGGEAAEFASVGGFAGVQSQFFLNYYIARRDSKKGWQTSAVSVPATLGAQTSGVVTSYDLTKQLVRTLYLTGEKEGTCGLLLSGDLLAAPALSFVELTDYPSRGEKLFGGTCITPQDESPNFANVFFGGGGFTGGGPLREISGVGGPTEALRFVLGPEGKPITAVPGNGSEVSGGTLFHAISNDGSEIFFTPGEGGGGESYVGVNGSRTLGLGGLFQGASENGAKVFVSGGGGGLYMDEIDSKPGHEGVTKKVALTPGAAGTYLRSGDDGSHVYFNSKGVFGEPYENENKEMAEPGKENLYVYDTVTETTAFIAQALPGGNLSTREVEAQVNGCPSTELGEAGEPGCEGGRFFVFTTEAHITPGDMAGGAQVFEYDAKTGHLARVSLGEDGYDDNGNGGAGSASIAVPEPSGGGGETQMELFEDGTRAVSDDGSTVVFSTARALSPRAVNDQQPQPGPKDIYEYHDGQVSLLSTGHSPTSDEQPTITPSGRDVFFTSTEGILPQDSDGLKSLYDARIEGGFRAAAVEEGGCNGDSCQGPPSVPNLLGAGASATFSGLGNPAPAASTPVVKPKAKAKPKACKKGYVRKKGKCVKKPKPKKKAKKAGHSGRAKS